MQSIVMQLDGAIALLKSTGGYMREYRDTGFDKAIEVASEIASRFDDPVETSFEIEKRTRRKKQHFDAEGENEPVTGVETKFKIECFSVIVDQAISKLEECFEQMVTFNDRYGFVHQAMSGEPLEAGELEIKCKDTATYFEEDIAGDELITKIKSFQGMYKKRHPDTDAACTASVLSVLKYMYDNHLHEIYFILNIILRMFLTVPVKVTSGETSFSKLKIIKNYLRSSMAPDRLTVLALISVEHEVGRPFN